jgi:hypothetical protein
VISSWVKAPGGQVLSQSDLNTLSAHLPASVQNSPSPDAFTNWMTQHGYTLGQSVQPDSRFWQFQLTEGGWLLVVSALLIGGTVLLIGGTVWLVRRRGALVALALGTSLRGLSFRSGQASGQGPWSFRMSRTDRSGSCGFRGCGAFSPGPGGRAGRAPRAAGRPRVARWQWTG